MPRKFDICIQTEAKDREDQVKEDALRWNYEHKLLEFWNGSAWVSVSATDSNAVHKSGNESISGTKTFSSSVTVSANPLIRTGKVASISVADESRESTYNKLLAVVEDKDGLRFGGIEVTGSQAGARNIHYTMRNRANTGWLASFQFEELKDGTTASTVRDTPAKTDSSKKVATTEFVKNVIGDYVAKSDLINTIYPVGSIYCSTVSTNPNTLFGVGTWERIGEGKCLIDAGSTYTAGTAVGAATKSYTPAGTVGGHTLTEAEMPSHTHNIYAGWPSYTTSSGHDVIEYDQLNEVRGYINDAYGVAPLIQYTGGGGSHNHGFTGTKASINVMQPSLPVYIWKRTA